MIHLTIWCCLVHFAMKKWGNAVITILFNNFQSMFNRNNFVTVQFSNLIGSLLTINRVGDLASHSKVCSPKDAGKPPTTWVWENCVTIVHGFCSNYIITCMYFWHGGIGPGYFGDYIWPFLGINYNYICASLSPYWQFIPLAHHAPFTKPPSGHQRVSILTLEAHDVEHTQILLSGFNVFLINSCNSSREKFLIIFGDTCKIGVHVILHSSFTHYLIIIM